MNSLNYLRAKASLRFWRKIRVLPNGCWEWIAGRTLGGYGEFYYAGKMCSAHKFVYETFRQVVPRGLQLDHLCRVRACVNPFHLEPVTQRENLLRGVGLTAQYARQTHCKHGHLFDEGNTYIDQGSRRCRTCTKVRMREYYKRRVLEESLGA